MSSLPKNCARLRYHPMGIRAINCVLSIALSISGSFVFASNAGEEIETDADIVRAVQSTNKPQLNTQNAGLDTDLARMQCKEGDWRGTPLIARYRVTNYTVSERTLSTPGAADQWIGRGAGHHAAPQASLHQSTLVDNLLAASSTKALSSTSDFVLWREGDSRQRVAHEHLKPAITEVWNQPSDSLLRRTRHFDSHDRAIEFEPFNIKPTQEAYNGTKQIGSESSVLAKPALPADSLSPSTWDVWMQKYHLAFELPPTNATELSLEGYTQLLKQGVGARADVQLQSSLWNQRHCRGMKVVLEQRQQYISEMVWDESIRLPVYMQTVRDNSAPLDFTQPDNGRTGVDALSLISRWVLVSLDSDEDRVAERFATWDSHDTTDFADIGDNESDPFLMRMINLGFISHGASGFYDASGNMISSGMGHFHPPAKSVR